MPSRLNPSAAKPPVAAKKPHTTQIHGETLIDDYFWLRDKKNPAVAAYLQAENKYAQSVMAPLADLKKTLYAEMVGRMKETDVSAPNPRDGWLYYYRTKKGKQFRIYCRKRPNGKEETLLDLNELIKGHKYISLGVFEPSDDGNILMYSLDFTGFREYSLYFKDLTTGRDLVDRVPKVTTAFWAPDNKTFFYATEDKAKRSYRVYRRKLGAKSGTLIKEEPDQLYWLYPYRSSDRKALMLLSVSSETTETSVVPMADPTSKPRLLLKREEGVEDHFDRHDDAWIVRSNRDAKNFKIASAPIDDPSPAKWTILLEHDPAIKREETTIFKNHMVVSEWQDGLPHLRVFDFATGQSTRIPPAEPIYALNAGTNDDYDTDTFRFTYDSFTTPQTHIDYNLKTGAQKIVKQVEVKGFVPSKYVAKRLLATASDGTKVPIGLVHRKDIKPNRKTPTLLYGYGSYGASMDFGFSSNVISLLDRGFVFAVAQIRGGGEMGEQWHDQGKMMQKMNTFTDFVACAEKLFEEKIASPDHLGIQGGSAGGLLIGAVVNLRPNLSRAAVLEVPFVDVINTMLDETLPLTVGEFLEWGNPKIKEQYDYIKQYCPYTNIQARKYADLMVRTSFNDSQVMYWEPAKYVAKMRAMRKDDGIVLLITNMDAGHGGSAGRYDYLKERAEVYAFLIATLAE